MNNQQEMLERYKTVKRHMVCPDCGSDLRVTAMSKIDPKGNHPEDAVGLKCIGEDRRGKCKYFIYGGEKKSNV